MYRYLSYSEVSEDITQDLRTSNEVDRKAPLLMVGCGNSRMLVTFYYYRIQISSWSMKSSKIYIIFVSVSYGSN